MTENPELMQGVAGFAMSTGAAAAGRLMHHSVQVQRGRRKFFSSHLLLEIPSVFGMGLVGQVAVWVVDASVQAAGFERGIPPWAGPGIIALFAYYGPHALQLYFDTVVEFVRARLGLPPKE